MKRNRDQYMGHWVECCTKAACDSYLFMRRQSVQIALYGGCPRFACKESLGMLQISMAIIYR